MSDLPPWAVAAADQMVSETLETVALHSVCYGTRSMTPMTFGSWACREFGFDLEELQQENPQLALAVCSLAMHYAVAIRQLHVYAERDERVDEQ